MDNIEELKVGDKVVDLETTYYGEPIIWTIVDKNHDGYPQNSVTLIADKILCLKPFDGKESANSDPNRRTMGNGNYKVSNLLQWLNSPSHKWYSSMHTADAPPNSTNVSYNDFETESGFLYGFSDYFLQSIKTTTHETVRCSLDGGGIESAESKIFLPSTTEVGLQNENEMPEGSRLEYFTTNNRRLCTPTSEAVDNSDYITPSFNTYDPWHWYLRTPNTNYTYSLRTVYSNGALSDNYAYYGSSGVRPLCNIDFNLKVQDSLFQGARIIGKSSPTIRYKNQSGTIQNIVAGRINGKEIINIYFKDKSGTIKNVK